MWLSLFEFFEVHLSTYAIIFAIYLKNRTGRCHPAVLTKL